jgi:predicted lipoprotein
MFVLVIIWDNVTGLDISGVDQYMKMTAAFAFVLYGGYAHTLNFEFQGKRCRHGGAIARLNKINRLRMGMHSE